MVLVLKESDKARIVLSQEDTDLFREIAQQQGLSLDALLALVVQEFLAQRRANHTDAPG